MQRRNRTVALTLWGAALVPATLMAQVPLPEGRPVDPALRFEVASIKPYIDSGPTRVRMQPESQLDITGASVRMLLQNAFRVRAEQVVELPDWGDSDRYSVLARGPAGAPITGIPTMLANLLADRFKLVTHKETRETQTFDLVLTSNTGKLGPALTPTSAECQATIAAGALAAAATPRATADQAPCGALQTGAGIVRAAGVPLARLVPMLSQFTERPVRDKTGLTELYDFTLRFNPTVSAASPADSDVPHLFTALQEQLGLRLSSQRGSAEVIVVDRVEKPTAD